MPYYAEYKGTGSDGFKLNLSYISPEIAFRFFIGRTIYYTLIVTYNSNGDVLKEYPELKDGKRNNTDLQWLSSIEFNHATAASYIRFMYYTGTGRSANYTGPFYTAYELKTMGIVD